MKKELQNPEMDSKKIKKDDLQQVNGGSKYYPDCVDDTDVTQEDTDEVSTKPTDSITPAERKPQ